MDDANKTEEKINRGSKYNIPAIIGFVFAVVGVLEIIILTIVKPGEYLFGALYNLTFSPAFTYLRFPIFILAGLILSAFGLFKYKRTRRLWELAAIGLICSAAPIILIIGFMVLFAGFVG